MRKTFPDAAPPRTLVTLTGGETDDLVAKGLSFAQRSVEARFFFRDGALTTIQLAPVDLSPAQTRGNLQLAHHMSEALDQEYGAPFDCDDKSFAGVAMFDCKWFKAPVIVRLWYIDVSGQAPDLRIVFRRADDPSYDF